MHTFKFAKLDYPYRAIYIPSYIRNFEIIDCFTLVNPALTNEKVKIIIHPSTQFINTYTEAAKYELKTIKYA